MTESKKLPWRTLRAAITTRGFYAEMCHSFLIHTKIIWSLLYLDEEDFIWIEAQLIAAEMYAEMYAENIYKQIVR